MNNLSFTLYSAVLIAVVPVILLNLYYFSFIKEKRFKEGWSKNLKPVGKLMDYSEIVLGALFIFSIFEQRLLVLLVIFYLGYIMLNLCLILIGSYPSRYAPYLLATLPLTIGRPVTYFGLRAIIISLGNILIYAILLFLLFEKQISQLLSF